MNAGQTAPLLLTYYGDDFTGSTDVMDALGRSGIPAVLFLRIPTDDQIARFPDVRAIGIAGITRSQSPEWMSEHLPPVFERLKSLSAPICQYKICSTFDSSPRIGSIGRALDLGQHVFHSSWVPVVVGAPILRRYCVFGNLFATVDGMAYRLDRHPTMSRHPITPMRESDLCVHLSRQTAKRIGLIDVLALRSLDIDAHFEQALTNGAEVLLFDVLDQETLCEVGRLIWTHAQRVPVFAVASSGLDYALVEWWRRSGNVAAVESSFAPMRPERVLVVSGSCSPVTETQIRWAVANGFEGIPLDAGELAEGAIGPGSRVEGEVVRAAAALQEGRSAIVYSALGSASPVLLDKGDTVTGTGARIAASIGVILKNLLLSSGVRRAVVAGGDTSGLSARELDIFAVTMIRPLAPGGPLCRTHSDAKDLDGLEIVFKGGQVGTTGFFGLARDGMQ